MFCMNCGTKLPDKAKFCYNCGEKINIEEDSNNNAPSSNSTEKQRTIKENDNSFTQAKNKEDSVDKKVSDVKAVKVQNGRDFKILDNTIHFTDETIKVCEFHKRYVEIAYESGDKAYNYFLQKFEETKDDMYGIQDIFISSLAYCSEGVDYAFNDLIRHGVDIITKDKLAGLIDKRIKESDEYKQILKGIENIEKMKHQLAVEKEMNKANWVGGGFGLSGAIRGAINAKVLNMASDGLSSLGRSITGNSYSSRLDRYKNAQVGSAEYYANGVWEIVVGFIKFDLPDYVNNKLSSVFKMPKAYFYTSTPLQNRRKNIQELLRTFKITKEEAIKRLCETLPLTHNRKKFYDDILNLDMDAYEGLSEIAELDGNQDVLTHKYLLMNRKKIIDALVPYVGDNNAKKYDWTKVAANQTDILAIVNYIKAKTPTFNPFSEDATEEKEPKIITIELLDNTFKINHQKIREILNVLYNVKLVFKGLGQNAKVIIDSEKLLVDEYDDFFTFYNVEFDESYRQIIDSRCQELDELSKTALNNNEYEEAAIYLKKMSVIGNDDATFRLANLYLNELNDLEKALKYFAVCPHSNPDAVFQVATLKKEKLNDTKEYDDFMKIAASGYMSKAEEYQRVNNFSNEIDMLVKAAKCNSDLAYLKLAKIYETGKGTDIDYQKAVQYYEKSISLGNNDAYNSLADLYLRFGIGYEEGISGVSDFPLAKQYYATAADMKNVQAMIRLADICSNKSLQGLYDYNAAMTWYRIASLHQADTVHAIRKLRSAGTIEERINFVLSYYPARFKDSYYHFNKEISSSAIENAVKAYAQNYSISDEKVFILYDATRSTFFGIGKKGFVITSGYKIITSLPKCISLYKIDSLIFKGNDLIALPSNEVILTYKKVDDTDYKFINMLNEEVLANKCPFDMAMKECPNCKAVMEADSVFCAECGTRII